MMPREQLTVIENQEYHKGFYNDINYLESLSQIKYNDYFEKPDDENFPCDTAAFLLNGLCCHFAVELNRIYSYNTYIIQAIDDKRFHIFCQIYENSHWYFVDVRGITSSFGEFMEGAREFVGDEFTIQSISPDELIELVGDEAYKQDIAEFSKAVITQYRECYTL